MIVECKKCEARVDAKLITTHTVNDFLESRFHLLICPKCDSAFLITEDIMGETVLFPPNENSVNPNLPKPLQSSYSEALACYKVKSFTATAIMCRKTLEGICVEHEVKGHNLVSSLKELREKGIIESKLYEWADALRISGNEAAHDVNVTVSAEDARDILEFTKALMEYVFTFRDKFEEFKKRRDSKSGTFQVTHRVLESAKFDEKR
jgi:hypothetical protein